MQSIPEQSFRWSPNEDFLIYYPREEGVKEDGPLRRIVEKVDVDINTEELDNQIGAPLAEKLRGELELVDGVYPEFNVDDVNRLESITHLRSGNRSSSQ